MLALPSYDWPFLCTRITTCCCSLSQAAAASLLLKHFMPHDPLAARPAATTYQDDHMCDPDRAEAGPCFRTRMTTRCCSLLAGRGALRRLLLPGVRGERGLPPLGHRRRALLWLLDAARPRPSRQPPKRVLAQCTAHAWPSPRRSAASGRACGLQAAGCWA